MTNLVGKGRGVGMEGGEIRTGHGPRGTGRGERSAEEGRGVEGGWGWGSGRDWRGLRGCRSVKERVGKMEVERTKCKPGREVKAAKRAG